MRFPQNARPNVMPREEKEARLRAFITNHLNVHRAAGIASGVTTYRLLALSAESPVARAFAELAPEITAAGISMQAVLTRRDGQPMPDGIDCRFVTDVRVLDAHEQLVLDRATAWLGDCMRRDPLKRDAYEFYSDSPVTASYASRSFTKIWDAAGPKGSLASERRWASLRQASLFDPMLIAGAEAMVANRILPIRH